MTDVKVSKQFDKPWEQGTQSVFERIRGWSKYHGLLDGGDVKTQYVKLMEECGELADAIIKNDREAFEDAVGDIVVVLTNLCALAGYANIEDCVEQAYEVIRERRLKLENGTLKKY